MKSLFNFVSLIESPKGEKNQNKGKNGAQGAKCKILISSIHPEEFFVATVCSNREARKATKKLKSGSLVRVILGSKEDGFHFLKDTPIVHVSDIQVINFFKTNVL